MVEHLYGQHYRIYPFYLNTEDVGHRGMARARVYIFLAHKERVCLREGVDIYEVYRKIAATIKSAVQTQPRDYLISSAQEVAMDVGRVGSKRKLSGSDAQPHFECERMGVSLVCTGCCSTGCGVICDVTQIRSRRE